jgi:hypothetical protein
MRKWGINPSDINYDDLKNYDEARKKLELMASNCPYKTIIVDSITTGANSILKQTLDLKRGGTRKSGQAAGKLIANIAVNEIEDYNAEASALLEMVALLKDIRTFHNVNVILIAHLIQAEYKTGPNAPSNIVRTIVTSGKRVAPMIPAYCEEVYHFFLKKSFDADGPGQYALLTSSTTNDFARTQLELPAEIIFNDDPIYSRYIRPAIDKLNTNTQEPTTK